MTDRFGLLYDSRYDREFAARPAAVDFLEIIPDRFFALEDLGVLPDAPTVFHSLDLSIGSDEPLDQAYLDALALLARHCKPLWASDHLAVSKLDGTSLGQLTPVRWRAASVERMAGKLMAVQDRLGVPFLIENIAYYVRLSGADLSEGELLHRLVAASGCGVLLDLNNLAVNAANHDFDPYAYLREFPLHAVGEIHIAGNRRRGAMLIDSHGDAVGELVWELLRYVARALPSVCVVLERDQDLPPFAELLRELAIARQCVEAAR
jgi:uncharacterized protein